MMSSIRDQNNNKDNLITWRHAFEDRHIQGYMTPVEAGSPTVHFLHGNGFAVKTYCRFLSQLKGYNLIMQDAAGHGGSSAGEKFVGWNKTALRFSLALQAQRAQLSQAKLIGMGHSFGGCMTLLMSEQQPELFDQLVLLDPALFPPRLIWMMRGATMAGLKSRFPLARQARRRRTQWNHIDDVRKSFFERGTFKGWEPECLEDYIKASIKQEEQGQCQLTCPTWMEEAIFSSYPKGLWHAVANLKVPTVILQGKETFDYLKEAYQLAVSLNPNIRVIEVEGGHCFMQQYSEATAQKVLSLL
ncbi:alpha/beta fold hydrolase [Marinomonas algarum]|uniref:Alpha/beta hydrolase n=1 Tax=Marinomonas algarum TaxID=2883105 RepID=A0A9X1IN94_9GAMM|nr:alpha/beta hydrolase [Marinomonas algarum]MCB5162062.1 alpha/beta hydrolase [Marinomonas algarum]